MRSRPKNNMYHYDLNVEFEDVDSYGIVHHTKLIAYLERARVHYFDSKGFNLRNLPFSLIVYKIKSRFIKPALFLDRLCVEVSIAGINSFYLTVLQRILRGKDIILKAKIVHVLVSAKTGKTVPIPDDFQQALIS